MLSQNPENNPDSANKTKMIEKGTKKENPLLNLGINIIIPTVIMMKYSTPEYLGQIYGLITALSFPILYGVYDLIGAGKVNLFSLLGLISILITGGIGLLELNRNWMIVKETAIPFIMGLFVLASERTSNPFVKTFLNQMLDLDLIIEKYREINREEVFTSRLKRSSYMLGSTFFVSAFLNFALATWILEGNPGTTEFVESLGKMTLYSFPVITIPMMIMVGFILHYLFKGIKEETNLEIEAIFRQ